MFFVLTLCIPLYIYIYPNAAVLIHDDLIYVMKSLTKKILLGFIDFNKLFILCLHLTSLIYLGG